MHALTCKLRSSIKLGKRCINLKTNKGDFMKKLVFLIIICFFSLSISAQDHAHHSKHNMVLFGEGDSYYASHIVYKEPHNYQVILKLNFDSSTKEVIAKEMSTYPDNQFIYLLDHLDISQINERPTISGQIFRRSADESKKILFDKVDIDPNDYSIIYFNELPLSLESQKSSGWEELQLPPKENCHRIKCQ